MSTKNEHPSYAVMAPGGAVLCLAVSESVAKEILTLFEIRGKKGYYLRETEDWMLDIFKND